MGLSYQFKGFSGDETKKFSKAIMEKALWKTGKEIERRAKDLCPKMYGSLAASINIQMKNKGTNVEDPSEYAEKEAPINRDIYANVTEISQPEESGVVNIGTNVEYAESVEFGSVSHDVEVGKGGTAKMLSNYERYFGKKRTIPAFSPQPFLRPALDYGNSIFGDICASMSQDFEEAVSFAKIAKYIDM